MEVGDVGLALLCRCPDIHFNVPGSAEPPHLHSGAKRERQRADVSQAGGIKFIEFIQSFHIESPKRRIEVSPYARGIRVEEMMHELSGKVVVVTGASRGIGEAMAVGLARAGASVALLARTEADLERVAALCREAGAGQVLSVVTDVTTETEMEAAFELVVAELGGLDVVIANAGVAASSLGVSARMTKLEWYSADVALRILEVNTLGVWLTMKAAFPRMSRGGSFIAISSELGLRPGSGGGILAVSKAGVNALVSIAAEEQAEHGIRVNILSPGGMVDTQLFGPAGIPAGMKARLPVAEPEVVVPAALWLAGDNSTDVTGSFLSAPHFNASTPEAIRTELG